MWLAALGQDLGNEAICQQPGLQISDGLGKPLARQRVGRLERALEGLRELAFQLMAFAAGHGGSPMEVAQCRQTKAYPGAVATFVILRTGEVSLRSRKKSES
jgi:hypothetical protein